jgi:hypothetical protein
VGGYEDLMSHLESDYNETESGDECRACEG